MLVAVEDSDLDVPKWLAAPGEVSLEFFCTRRWSVLDPQPQSDGPFAVAARGASKRIPGSPH